MIASNKTSAAGRLSAVKGLRKVNDPFSSRNLGSQRKMPGNIAQELISFARHRFQGESIWNSLLYARNAVLSFVAKCGGAKE